MNNRPFLPAARLVFLLTAALLMTGCGCEKANAGEEASGPTQFDSPQAAFDALSVAFEAKDPVALSHVLTADAQEAVAGMLAIVAGIFALDEEKRPEVEKLLENYELIKDEPAFIAEVLAWIEKNDDDDSALSIDGALRDLKVDGETAKGVIVATKGGAERKGPIEFRKVDGSWRVHFSWGKFRVASNAGPSAADSQPVPQIPDKAVGGTIFGRKFQPDRIEFSQYGRLTMRQGKDADAQISLFLRLGKVESPAGRTWNVSPEMEFGVPHIYANAKNPDGHGRQRETYTGGDYTMFLSFSEQRDGLLTGRVRLTLTDDTKNQISGTFQVEPPLDPTKPPSVRYKPFIHGQIDFQPQKEDWLHVGYVGVTAEGKRQSNMVGIRIGPKGGRSSVAGLTYEPRVSRLDVFEDAPATYRHVRLEPGHYLAYIKWGHKYLVTRWIEVRADSAVAMDFPQPPKEPGALEVTLAKDTKQKVVRLLSVNEPGELPAVISASDAHSLAFSLSFGLSAEIKNGMARFEQLRPGAYRVFLDRDDFKDVTVEAGATATVDFR